MTNLEFDILDELYFLTSFKDLKDTCRINPPEINLVLWQLVEKGWVLCHRNNDQEIIPTKPEFESQFVNYHYLASKKGLLAHNAR